MSDHITCPRRMGEWGPWEHKEGLDSMAGGRCSFCGSADPARVLDAIEAGTVEIGTTDKSYKIYVRGQDFLPPGKCYFHHFTKDQQARFIQLLNDGKVKFEGGFGFYVLPFFIARKPEEGGR